VSPQRPPTDREVILEAAVDAAIETRLQDHEERIREVEKWQWKHTGLMVLVLAAATWWVTEDLRLLRAQIIATPAVMTVPRR